jgi:predicted GIY-YIG superfamily endonuclease
METYAIEFDLRQFEPCVYLLYKDETLNYIGYSAQLGARLLNHKRNGILFNKILFIPCETSQEALALEKELIHQYKPPYNKNLNSNYQGMDIPSVIKQELAEIVLQQENEIEIERIKEEIDDIPDNLIISGQKFTLNKNNAMFYSRVTKKAPIYFIHPELRETFLRAWPELGLPPINGKSVD